MGSKKKNKKSQKKYPKKRTYRKAFVKLSHSKSRGKKKWINSIKELDWQLKGLKIMKDEKSNQIIRKKKTIISIKI